MAAPILPLLALLAQAAPAATPAPNDYADAATWLCRPGRVDACRTDQRSTGVAKDGTLAVKPWTAAAKPAVDCFYVYPTVSLDPTANSDMTAGREETAVVNQQLNRLGSVCRLFAPLYRQVTLTALRSGSAGRPMAGVDRDLGYRDVRDAWRQYLKADNGGRGVVLIGHSQGSGVLKRLLAEEIDGKPVQRQLVGAYLGGTNLLVPTGRTVGGDLKAIPTCTAAGQTGCVVSWVSFRTDAPPPPNTRFGRTDVAGRKVACVNPASFSGADVPLDSYLNAGANSISEQGAVTWAKRRTIATPFVQVPGLVTGACVDRDGAQYLAITVHADPADPRTDQVPGDVVQAGKVQQDWGLHLIDINLVMGDIIANVRRQSSLFSAAR